MCDSARTLIPKVGQVSPMNEIRIPAHLVDSIVAVFPDRRADIGPGAGKIATMDEIMFLAGQQSVIDFIKKSKV